MARRGNGARLKFRAARGLYYIYYTDTAGCTRQQSTGTSDLAGAELALAKFNVSSQAVKVAADDPLYSVLANYALARADEVADPARIGFAVTTLIEFMGDHCARDVTPALCKQYSAWRKKNRKITVGQDEANLDKPISDGTIRRELTTLRAAINLAGLGSESQFWLPAMSDPRPRWLTRSEAASLLWAARRLSRAGRHLTLFIQLGLWTGRRKAAILDLKWSNVDLKTGMVDFRSETSETSTKRRGHVLIPSRLLGHLRRARKKAVSEYVIEYDGKGVDDIRRSFSLAVEAAGLTGHVTPHALRHTTATWLMQADVPPFSAAGYLSMSIETLTKVYAKWSPHHHTDVLRALS